MFRLTTVEKQQKQSSTPTSNHRNCLPPQLYLKTHPKPAARLRPRFLHFKKNAQAGAWHADSRLGGALPPQLYLKTHPKPAA